MNEWLISLEFVQKLPNLPGWVEPPICQPDRTLVQKFSAASLKRFYICSGQIDGTFRFASKTHVSETTCFG